MYRINMNYKCIPIMLIGWNYYKKKSPLNLLSELQIQIICLIHRTNDVCEIFYKHSSFYIYILKMWMLWQILFFKWLSIFLSNFSFINVKLMKIMLKRNLLDRMVIGFTTTYTVSAYHHWCCEFKSWSGQGVNIMW